ncbi:MAG: aspartate kinase [Candidatus Brocadiia bacterium]
MIVMKFGGTSLKDASRIKSVAGIIRRFLKDKPMVVVSAHHGVTEKLIGLAHGIAKFHSIEKIHLKIAGDLGVPHKSITGLLDELKQYAATLTIKPSLKQLDKLMSFGERLSARIISVYLNKHGIKSRAVDAFDAGLLTDSHFSQAQPLDESPALIRKHLKPIIGKGIVPVITGFIGRDSQDNITTLGRNGSDYTATIMAAALNAGQVQLWSDSDGIMTADPRVVPEAMPIKNISFNEASELAYYSRRFHPSTLLPAIRRNIPVRILNTYKPEAEGTIITARTKPNRIPAPRSIVYKKDIYLITITSPRMLMQYGFLEHIFGVFARHKIVVDMIATSEISVSVTIDRRHHLTEALKELSKFARVNLEDKQALICVIGEDIKRLHGISGNIFGALRDADIKVKMISQGATQTNIAFLVENSSVNETVRALHRVLFC